MENASQALIIAGAILLAILIIAIGMYIYNAANTTIQDSMTGMNASQIEAFNSNYENYKGKQSGAQVSALAGRLIANAKTYEAEPGKIPNVVCNQIAVSGANAPTVNAVADNTSGNQASYINEVSKLKNFIESKHTYTITMDYNGEGVISSINIAY